MKLLFSSLLCGLIFGAGLTVAQMTNPAKVLNFLDLAGDWDPSLMLVMVGALLVTILCFRPILKRSGPLWDSQFYLSTKTALDKPLLIGAALFGIGWGIAGYCPGPVVAGLGLGNIEAVVMLVGIYGGFFLHKLYEKMNAKKAV